MLLFVFDEVVDYNRPSPVIFSHPASLARSTAVYQGLVLVLCCSAVWGQIVKESSDRYAYG